MNIYCLRHGRAEHNLNHIMNGDSSKQFHLIDLGKEQAKQAAEKLKGVKIDIIFTSEFLRTKETVEIINENKGIGIKRDSRLNDLKSGLEGLTYDCYLTEREKSALEQKTDIYNAKINDGESVEEEKQRVYSFLNYLKKQKYNNVLIVAHYDTIVAIYGYVNDLNNEQMFELRPKCGEVYKFKI